MRKYILRRLLQLVPVVLTVLAINFVLIHAAPGDPAVYLAGEDPNPQYIASIRHAYGLDRPLWQQFIVYIGRVLQGDLGRSHMNNRMVLDLIKERLPATLFLIITAYGLSAIIGTLLGGLAAKRPGSWADTAISTGGILGHSVPVFWLGLMMIALFAVKLDWLPTSGLRSVEMPRSLWAQGLVYAKHLILPAATLALTNVGQYIRLSRASVVEVMEEDFITTARGVGYPENTIFLRHALRNALLPVVTIAGLQLGAAFAGATLTETVFAWPGLGRLMFESIMSRDYPLLMGSYLILATTVVLANMLTDIVYAYLDPRVAYS